MAVNQPVGDDYALKRAAAATLDKTSFTSKVVHFSSCQGFKDRLVPVPGKTIEQLERTRGHG